MQTQILGVCRHQRTTQRQIELCVQKGVIREGPFLARELAGKPDRMAAGEELTCVVAINWVAGLLEVRHAFRPGS